MLLAVTGVVAAVCASGTLWPRAELGRGPGLALVLTYAVAVGFVFA
jgi:hypothetical protein